MERAGESSACIGGGSDALRSSVETELRRARAVLDVRPAAEQLRYQRTQHCAPCVVHPIQYIAAYITYQSCDILRIWVYMGIGRYVKHNREMEYARGAGIYTRQPR